MTNCENESQREGICFDKANLRKENNIELLNFSREPSPYFRELRKKPHETPDSYVDGYDQET